MPKARLNYSICLVSAIAALAGLLFGFDTGIISGALLPLQHEFNLGTGMSELVVSSVLLGAMFGSLASGTLTDSLGRRKVMLIIAGLFIVGTLAASFAEKIEMIVWGRVVIGVAIGIGSYAAPLYIAEASPFEWRGGLVTLNQLAITIGIMIAYIVSYNFIDIEGSWRWMFFMGVIPAVLLGIGMIFLPESPRWLVKRKRMAEAQATLQYLRAHRDVGDEINEIENSLSFKAAGFAEVFSPWIRHVLFLGMFLGFLQQVTGINTVIYYAPTIFKMAGFHDASHAIFATIGIGVLNVCSTVFAMFLIDKLGRRPLLFAGLTGMGMSLLFLSMAFELSNNAGYLRYAALASLFIYVMSFAFSLGALLWLMVSEIFPLEVRGTAMSVAVFSCWFWNFVVSFNFLTMVDSLGAGGTFFIYALMCGLGLAISYFIVPETKSVSLETIEEQYSRKTSLAQNWLNLKMPKITITWDLGATKCAAAVVSYYDKSQEFVCTNICYMRLDSVENLDSLVFNIEKKLNMRHQDADTICIGAAGIFNGETLHLEKGYPYAMPLAAIARKYAWPKLHVVHDYVPIICATFCAGIKAQHIHHGEPNPFGRRVAFGIGTGLGLKDGVLLPTGEIWLGVNEMGHLGLSYPIVAPKQVLAMHHAFTRDRGLSFEDVLCGQGMLKLHRFLHPSFSSASPEELGILVRAGQADETLRWFAFYVGMFNAAVQLCFMPSGGIWIAGGVVLKHPQLFACEEYFHGLNALPAYRSARSLFPVRLLTDENAAFLGAAYFAQRHLNHT